MDFRFLERVSYSSPAGAVGGSHVEFPAGKAPLFRLADPLMPNIFLTNRENSEAAIPQLEIISSSPYKKL